jgi:hypothetical protein
MQHLTGWLDYDRPSLHLLTPNERIDYFEKRVRLVVVNPLDRILNNEVHVASDSSALLIFGVALCSAIEATGKFRVGCLQSGGAGVNKTRFQSFLKHYMAPEYQTHMLDSSTYGDVLWKHFRNGLAHGFSVCHGGFEGNRGEPYFSVRQITGQNSLLVNPYVLFSDYLVGLGRYLSELRGCQPTDQLFTDFDMVFDAVFIKGQ